MLILCERTITITILSTYAGDRIAIASTDYDMFQAEEATVVLCESSDCAPNEIRIDGR